MVGDSQGLAMPAAGMVSLYDSQCALSAYIVHSPSESCHNEELPLEAHGQSAFHLQAPMDDNHLPIANFSSRHLPTNSDFSRYDSVVDKP